MHGPPHPNFYTLLRAHPRIAAGLCAVALLLIAIGFSFVFHSTTPTPPPKLQNRAVTADTGDSSNVSPATEALGNGIAISESPGTTTPNTGDHTPPPSAVAIAGTHPFVWPTPLNLTATTPWEKFIQAAASGDPATGLFGLHRNNGSKFHEGVDIRPAARDRRGEPTDTVRAAVPGVIAYVAPKPNGPYGRYVVLWHAEPGLRYYTLYAHLRSVSPALRPGAPIEAGAELGVMGRSDEGRGFPKERAHVHFEAGLRLSPNFGAWYSRQKEFGSPNRHGAWNGINLSGIDSLQLLRHGLATGRTPHLLTSLRAESTAATVYLTTTNIPAFVHENPALLATPLPPVLAGWKIEFAWHGLPVRWFPLGAPPAPPPGAFVIKPSLPIRGVSGPIFLEITTDHPLARKATLRGFLSNKADKGKNRKPTPGPGQVLQRNLGILFE